MTDLAHFQYLEKVAISLLEGKGIPAFPYERSFHLEVIGFVYPKERQRTGKNGHHYTPTNTRAFENRVRERAITAMQLQKLSRFTCPVSVHLEIYDQIHSATPEWKRKLMKAGLYFEHTGGDLDNKEKAVLDALNKVVYQDDRLVVQHYKFRRFRESAGFKITVTPCGLTKGDLINIEKSLSYGIKNAQEEVAHRITR